MRGDSKTSWRRDQVGGVRLSENATGGKPTNFSDYLITFAV
jgi:hypothetical protein